MSESVIQYLTSGSYACFVIAGILLVLAVVLFFTLKIKDVIYELSGKAKTTLTAKMTADYQNTGSLRAQDANVSGSLKKSGDINRSLMMTNGLNRKENTGQIRKASKPQQRTTAQTNGFRLTKDIVVIHTNERV